MAESLEKFHMEVSRAIRRGNVYDEDIPGFVQEAVQDLEREHDWKAMYKEPVQATLTIGVGTLDLIRMKQLRWIKIISDAGHEFPLRKIQREQVSQRAAGRPGGFWTSVYDPTATSTIKFDNIPDKAYKYEHGFFQFSEMDDDLFWLRLAPRLVMAEAIMLMAPILRDDKLVPRWSAVRNPIMTRLLETEILVEFDGADGQMVPFTREILEDDLADADFLL